MAHSKQCPGLGLLSVSNTLGWPVKTPSQSLASGSHLARQGGNEEGRPRKGKQRIHILSCPAQGWPGWEPVLEGPFSTHQKVEGCAGQDRRLPTLLRV